MQKCSLSHSIEGKGQAKGPLDDVGNKLKAEDIRKWLIDPTSGQGPQRHTEAGNEGLPKEDLEALIAYMLSLKKS